MIRFEMIQALRSLPDDFAADRSVEVCECRGFLLASRKGCESLCFRMSEVRGRRTDRPWRWVVVSKARCMDGSAPEAEGNMKLETGNLNGWERYEQKRKDSEVVACG